MRMNAGIPHEAQNPAQGERVSIRVRVGVRVLVLINRIEFGSGVESGLGMWGIAVRRRRGICEVHGRECTPSCAQCGRHSSDGTHRTPEMVRVRVKVRYLQNTWTGTLRKWCSRSIVCRRHIACRSDSCADPSYGPGSSDTFPPPTVMRPSVMAFS